MFSKLRAALARALMHVLLTFVIAGLIGAGVVLGIFYLTSGIGGIAIFTAIVAGLIIGMGAGIIALIVEAVRGVEAGVHEVESGIGDVAKGVESTMHRNQPQQPQQQQQTH